MTSKNPPMITGLDHLVLTVSDMVTSIAFYRDILGMEALEFEAADEMAKSSVWICEQPKSFTGHILYDQDLCREQNL